MTLMNNKTQIDSAGTLDPDFADGGVFTLAVDRYPDTFINGIASDPTTGLHYFAAHTRLGNTNHLYAVGRLTDNGVLDPAFGNKGLTTGVFQQGAENRGLAITSLDQGNILLTGTAGEATLVLARLRPDGTLDSSYGDNGQLILRNPHAGNTPAKSASSPALQSPGSQRQVVSFTYQTLGQPAGAYVYALNSDGTLDSSFNHVGYVNVVHPDHAVGAVMVNSALIADDGGIVTCGSLRIGTSYASLFARYTSNGSLDPAFGDRGFVITEVAGARSARFANQARQGNNRTLGVGHTNREKGLLFSIEPDGQPNIQFNGAKPLLTQLDNASTVWSSAVRQTDGNLLVAGMYLPDRGSTIALARFQSNGVLDLSFNNGRGWVSTRPDDRSGGAVNVTLQADGKILLSGHVSNSDSTHQGVILRYLA